ncbi:DUF2975 domain-containing protein [Aureibaculum luteum]|uniref:DUF2975 domain-containing protein n=1 Tax=Aureibaculum luteum TaxID=1548456 RepID=UPI000E533F57|nr:DUF2975 domain-containing protein [Aureibaculum luteum]
MTKNIILNIAVYICKFLKLTYLLLLIGVTVVFVHYQINPKSYDSVYFNEKSNKTYEFKIKQSSPDSQVNKEIEMNKMTALNKIKTGSLYFLYLRLGTILVLSYLITKQFQIVITSVKKMETFKKNNAISFKRIGIYLFIIFIITSFWSVQYLFGDKYYEINKIEISLTPLIWMLLSFIMAEIFKEGHKISEENELTV